MSTTIDEIKSKYKVSEAEAYIIYSAVNREGLPLHIIMSIYRTIPKSGNIALNLKSAIHAYETTKIHAKRPIGTKDDRSTKFLSTKFTENQPGFLTSTKDGSFILDKHGNKIPTFGYRTLTDSEGNKLQNLPSKSISTRRMLTADEYKEKHPSPRDIPPKYYYFDLDLKFNNRGYERSPQYDTQFRGYYHHVPYARVTVGKVISPSHYPVPITDEAGNIIGREKTRGTRLLDIDLFFEGETTRIQANAPYESRSEFDMIQGVEIVNRIREIIGKFMSDRVKLIYKQIKEDKDIDTILTKTDRELGISKKIESDKAMREYYGEGFTERKRKYGKSSPKRKTTVKKKTTRKKCICKPTVHKKRVMAIKKKLSVRRKRK